MEGSVNKFIIYYLSHLVPSVQFRGGSAGDPIWATEIDCSRFSIAINDLNEPGLLGCRWEHQVNNVPGCNHNIDAGVICIGNITSKLKDLYKTGCIR